ncbi:hypothetical protein GCM10019016_079560 [Streptomyces prasinosporus]|uniref:Cell division protein CrgA n=2 Tax=Streptomyces TaxID=1883 RepID=A0ABP6U0H9_9ACTN|nr:MULTISPECIES: hypothetical protein [Streptomyces]MCG0062208.1 hypothetical protein [Streptomyces tricolor]GHC13940.1 hypothetical protein GCM10010332_49780 [Streptomyces albogriseolus]
MSDSSSIKHNKVKIGRVHTRSVPNRIFGWSLFCLSLVVIVVNWIEEFSDLEVLPGGHSVFYLAGGVVAAVIGLWRAGVMDAKS